MMNGALLPRKTSQAYEDKIIRKRENREEKLQGTVMRFWRRDSIAVLFLFMTRETGEACFPLFMKRYFRKAYGILLTTGYPCRGRGRLFMTREKPVFDVL